VPWREDWDFKFQVDSVSEKELQYVNVNFLHMCQEYVLNNGENFQLQM
jgi:hypothetical protein